MSKNLEKEKWIKLLELVEKFKHIPFVDFVLVSGSMATGKIHEYSDFDLIIGTKPGRIFTTRMLSAFFFQIMGVRRKNSDTKEQAKDKICLNHFVTPKGYRLDEPHNKYWKELYQSLVPVYGDKNKIREFFNKNDWAGDIEPKFNKWIGDEKDSLRKMMEFIFNDIPGDIFENIFKNYQIKRIEKNLEKNLGYKPQVKYNDTEIRFHMDTKRIEEYLKNESDS